MDQAQRILERTSHGFSAPWDHIPAVADGIAAASRGVASDCHQDCRNALRERSCANPTASVDDSQAYYLTRLSYDRGGIGKVTSYDREGIRSSLVH